MTSVRLGGSGLEISPIILGMMSYGTTTGGHHSWALDLDAARPIVQAAFDAGITTFDTSNNYSDGTSEVITGQLAKELGPRDSLQIFTKVLAPTSTHRNSGGLSRIAILREIDASLTRLGTDYVDLYQVHRFDPRVPIEETMEALHDVVKSGKARYIGASSMWTWQFAQMQHAAQLHGWTSFISMQDQYNLLEREDEREMHPFTQATGVGVIPWSPLAAGYLARPWGEDGSGRAANDTFGQRFLRDADADANARVVGAVEAIAHERGLPMAQIALAWVASKKAVSAPIIGATKLHHVDASVAAFDLELSDTEIARLEADYTPRLPSGF
ncbi:aldo/keto reductase [Herbiconiux daphne]|uniref:Aldo/keto reductase n=1 Tax=Herbiconiux daphne TaxID=2970914 RepID=A0ABT2GZJ9_9MICO|nr:aldo/keto reductase [Herbiconiux daphne]MCS5733384.1 aldo/keto reductase [Herbiconiux daphne]